MFDRLEDLLIRLEEIMSELSEPSVVNDTARFQKLMKEQSDLAPIVDAYKEYKKCKETVEESLMMLEEETDEEMKELLKEELSEAKKRIPELENDLKILLLPKDPNDEKNVIVEIRAGAGGDEAALFAAEVYRMYVKYAESRRWRAEMMSLNENGIGGFKEVTFMITGQGAYSRLKYESGVHRVQRVPETESGGRIHTSTVTVAIMPEAEEIDFHLDLNECKFDVFRASGNGGQCVNTNLLIKGIGYIHGILSGHGIHNQYGLIYIHSCLDLFKLFHHGFIHMKTTCRIKDHNIMTMISGMLYGCFCNIYGILSVSHGENLDTDFFSVDLQLTDRCRTVNVTGYE